jgi:thiamine biosynthesis lipoprotein ApbE
VSLDLTATAKACAADRAARLVARELGGGVLVALGGGHRRRTHLRGGRQRRRRRRWSGAGRRPRWLREAGATARLAGRDGAVVTVGAWGSAAVPVPRQLSR